MLSESQQARRDCRCTDRHLTHNEWGKRVVPNKWCSCNSRSVQKIWNFIPTSHNTEKKFNSTYIHDFGVKTELSVRFPKALSMKKKNASRNQHGEKEKLEIKRKGQADDIGSLERQEWDGMGLMGGKPSTQRGAARPRGPKEDAEVWAQAGELAGGAEWRSRETSLRISALGES